ncbi:MAG: hypothetical protein LBQ22_06345 [Bacteroidales bacterium]|nr:hypothetical protein [Bacteroidales bacterium]
MKTSTKNILLVICLGSLIVFSSCKAKKPEVTIPQDMVELEIPCKNEGSSDKNYFRADGSSTSTDMSLSREKALTNAKQRLSGLINTQVKSVTDRYVNETEVGKNSDFEQKFENLTREVVNQTLSDISIVCEKNMVDKKTGKYSSFIAIEVNKEDMLKGISSNINKDQKLRVDYDKMKFEEIFNQEMEKLENSYK